MDFKNGISIDGVAVQPGYPQIAGLNQGKVLRSPDGTTVAFGMLQISDLPVTVARSNADNQFTVAQGIGGAASGQAEQLYVATKIGGTLPLILVGGATSNAQQIGVKALSLNKQGVWGESYTQYGVYGRGGSNTANALVGEANYASSSGMPAVLLLRRISAANAAANFGMVIDFEATTSTAPSTNLQAEIGTYWIDPTNGANRAALAFSVMHQTLQTRATLSGIGLGITTLAPAADLHVLVANNDTEARGIIVEGYDGIAPGPAIQFRRGSGTRTSPTDTVNGAETGRISFYGLTSGNWIESAYIRGVYVTGGEPRTDIAFGQDTGSTWVETMRLAAGKVGIGTTAPSAKLDVIDGYIRAREGTNTPPTTGQGLELVSTGSQGYVVSYDRDSSAYRPLNLHGLSVIVGGASTVTLGVGGASPAAKIYALRSQAVQLRLSTAGAGGSTLMSYSSLSGSTPTNGESLYIMANMQYEGSGFSQINASYPSWMVAFGHQVGDIFNVYRAPAGSNTNSMLFSVGATGHAYATGNFYPGGTSDCYFGRWGASTPFISGNVVIGGGLYPGNQGSYYIGYTSSPLGIVTNGNLTLYSQLYIGNQTSRYFRDDGTYTRFAGNFVVDGDLYMNGWWMSTRINQALLTTSNPTFGALSVTSVAVNAGGSTFGNTVTNYTPTSGTWGTTTTLIVQGADYSSIGFHDAGSRVDFIYCGGGIMELGYNGGWGNPGVYVGGRLGVGVALASNNSNRCAIRGQAADSATNALIVQNSNASNLFYLRNDGYSWVNQNWAVGSDERMKAKIRHLDHGHRRLHELRPIEHELPHTGSDRKHYGFVAQEVQAVYPELVSETQGLSEGDGPMLAIRYGDMIPLLVHEIQALREEIVQLKRERKSA